MYTEIVKDKAILTKYGKEIIVADFTPVRQKYYEMNKEILGNSITDFYKIVDKSELKKYDSLVRKEKLLNRQMQSVLRDIFDKDKEREE